MVDQRVLDKEYATARRTAVAFLKERYQAKEIDPVSDVASEWLEVEIRCGSRVVALEVGLPRPFPDEFPVVLVAERSAAKMQIPHLGRFRTLCIFDEAASSPNPDRPLDLITQCISRAKEIIESGLAGKNSSDYVDEIESYWDQNTEGKNLLSIVEVGTASKVVYQIHFDSKDGATTLLCDSLDQGRKWLGNLGAMPSSHGRALFLPVEGIGPQPLPRTNQQLLMRLLMYSPKSVRPLLKYIESTTGPSLVMASMVGLSTSEQGVLIAWEHQSYRDVRMASKRRNSAYEVLTNHAKDKKLRALSVTRVDRERLLFRGGVGRMATCIGNVAIVGCGAVGSHVAKSLKNSGVERFTLIDPDKLSFDNIERHVCGAVDVGSHKVEALRRVLVSHSPHVDCVASPHSILELLAQDSTFLNPHDFAVVALGSNPVELRLSRLLREGAISIPLLFVWVEPFMAGAHGFWVPPKVSGCFRCLFDDAFRFRNRVLLNPGEYLVREAGCQTTFAPYAVLEVERFITALSFFIDRGRHGQITCPSLFTWFGDLTTQRAQNRRINPKWAGANSYSSKLIDLPSTWLCKDCCNAI